ncbi:MAG TPA: class II aldolase/adducin family protein, partial [Chloroflexota bacterium]|nr:class II aldolase/adducin family protein [Chloroflexota bacterium]
MNFHLLHPRDQLVVIMNRIYHSGMTTLSGGNLSIKDDNGDIWITPSGIDKGQLAPRDMMRLCADGRVEGPHKPSSEFPFHRAIYRQRPDLHAIVHAHPPALVSFSIVREV